MTAAADVLDPGATPAALSSPRPFYWSVRREIWENRSLYIAPLIAAGLVLFGFVISLLDLPQRRPSHGMHFTAGATPTHQMLAAIPYSVAAAAVMITAIIVGVFYCLGALHGERRDRSILFWKSLPVSDLTTVLSKATVPMVILPVVTFVVVIVLQLTMLVISSVDHLMFGMSVVDVWTGVPLLHMTLTFVYALVVMALWHAPIYAWLLLVSAWAKRVTFLWAFLPPLAICLVEKIAFDTGYFAHFLSYRIFGGVSAAFSWPAHARNTMGGQPSIDLVGFLSTPGLWLGLLAAAALTAAAVWLRRNREPI